MPDPATLAFGVVEVPTAVPAGACIAHVARTEDGGLVVAFEIDDDTIVPITFRTEQCRTGVDESGRAAA